MPGEVARYRRDGFLFPLRAVSAGAARDYRRRLEAFEQSNGGPLTGHLRQKLHLLFTWANGLVRNPAILDPVEDLIGPNILCWGSVFFIKEARSTAHVTWHQDGTYWGLDTCDIVTAWVAFTDVPLDSGPMRFWPGSHRAALAHRDTRGPGNLLSRGQEIAVAVPESESVDVTLQAGEMSLHHVLLAHASGTNTTGDRRIGLAIRYIPAHARQTSRRSDTAMLVRGRDAHGHFELEPEPHADLDPAAIAAHRRAIEHHVGPISEPLLRT